MNKHKQTNLGSGLLGSFKMSEFAIRYSEFVPRFYNLTQSLGFTTDKIMPSRAFCSDESQGYPIILIAKHFGTFPFNHGGVGGVMSNDRHGPHAHHGDDLAIIHASHVGYDPELGQYGHYRRLQTTNRQTTSSCGKICARLQWYLDEYTYAKEHIFLLKEKKQYYIIIDNLLLQSNRKQGLILKVEQLIETSEDDHIEVLLNLSTSKKFKVCEKFKQKLQQQNLAENKKTAIGDLLSAELFSFKNHSNDRIDINLIDAMSFIVCSQWPALTAAQVNIQVEFDQAYRSIIKEPEYQNKNLLFISGLNVDISPEKGQLFPLTKFIPWAAYYQNKLGQHETWEQQELYDRLMNESVHNPDQINLEDAIGIMRKKQEIILPF
ncbi:MAG: hypothetical protein QM479_10545 [Pseudomonadota bacterium]